MEGTNARRCEADTSKSGTHVLITRSQDSIKTIQQKNLQGSSDDVVISFALKEKRVILTFDKDFLKKQTKNLQAVIFHFPKIPTSEITSLIDQFLIDLNKFRLSKGKILKFSKNGLEEL